MKSKSIVLGAVLAIAAAAIVQAGPAQAQALHPKLAADVKPAPAYAPVTERLVTANPTPIFSDLSETSKATGQFTRVGEPVNAIARVPEWDWILVGRNGEGIGYVPRSLLKPAHS